MDHAIAPTTAQRDERLRAVELLLSRQSVNLLQEPAPDGAELDLILAAGLRAPDHGRLRPWRFVLIRGEQRQAWADRLAEAAKARDPENGPAMAEKSRAWVARTPLHLAGPRNSSTLDHIPPRGGATPLAAARGSRRSWRRARSSRRPACPGARRRLRSDRRSC